jgi:hypothetical protein
MDKSTKQRLISAGIFILLLVIVFLLGYSMGAMQ